MVVDDMLGKLSYAQYPCGADVMFGEKTIGALKEMFLLSCKVEGISGATLDDYYYKLKRLRWYLETIGITAVEQNNVNHCRSFIYDRMNRNMKRWSVNGYFRVMRRFLNWIVDQELLDVSPPGQNESPQVNLAAGRIGWYNTARFGGDNMKMVGANLRFGSKTYGGAQPMEAV